MTLSNALAKTQRLRLRYETLLSAMEGWAPLYEVAAGASHVVGERSALQVARRLVAELIDEGLAILASTADPLGSSEPSLPSELERSGGWRVPSGKQRFVILEITPKGEQFLWDSRNWTGLPADAAT
jgi:hypothetical protein